jgi:hypothetical protein
MNISNRLTPQAARLEIERRSVRWRQSMLLASFTLQARFGNGRVLVLIGAPDSRKPASGF